MAGKGSAWRKQLDRKAYRESEFWDNVKKKKKSKNDSKNDSNDKK